MDLKSLIDIPSKLPTIPKVAQQLIESFSSEDVSVDEIARQLAANHDVRVERAKEILEGLRK